MKLPKFKIVSLLVASCIANDMALAVPDVTSSPYENAISELRSYCIERLCLGMTVQAVSALGSIEWGYLGGPVGIVRCTAIGYSIFGVFTAKDGTKFRVWFDIVTSKGEPEKRYRLLRADILLNGVTTLQADHLAQTLRERYGDTRKDRGNLWSWFSKSGLFLILVRRPISGRNEPIEVGLGAHYTKEESWLLTLPECRSGLPKL